MSLSYKFADSPIGKLKLVASETASLRSFGRQKIRAGFGWKNWLRTLITLCFAKQNVS